MSKVESGIIILIIGAMAIVGGIYKPQMTVSQIERVFGGIFVLLGIWLIVFGIGKTKKPTDKSDKT